MSNSSSTYKSYEDFIKDAHSPIVYCTLQLEGKKFYNHDHFSIKMNQNSKAHDEFVITALDNTLDSFEGEIMENSKNLLGKKVDVFLHQFGNIVFQFQGMISSIQNYKENGYGNIDIHVSSPTILMDTQVASRSFEKQTLDQIIAEIAQSYHGQLDIESYLNPENKGLVLPYTVQYNETDYQFLQRLATRYGEWFFYDGEKLIFGAKPYKTLTLQENVDLIHATFDLKINPQGFEYVAYEKAGASATKQSNARQNQPVNHLQSVALNRSEKIYPNRPTKHLNQYADDVNKHLQSVAWRKGEAQKNLLVVRGHSRNPEVSIGRDIKLLDINDKAMETYRVISISHHHNGAYEYYNEFVAVPFDTWVPQYFDEDALPLCEEQSAQVTDNNDPEGMGRVRVRFTWQSDQAQSPWVRMIQPHSGGGKGFHFIPEVGEEVMVGFENGNAEKPFVLGTQYNGAALSGYHTGSNDLKVIQTRSGTKIILNDAEGSVFIEDPSGNTYLMDGNGNINVNAPKNMTFTAGENLEINVGKNMTTQVGMNKSDTIGMNTTEQTGMLKSTTVGANAQLMVMGSLEEFIQGDVSSNTNGQKQVSGKEVVTSSNSGKINQNAKSEVQNNSGEKGNNY